LIYFCGRACRKKKIKKKKKEKKGRKKKKREGWKKYKKKLSFHTELSLELLSLIETEEKGGEGKKRKKLKEIVFFLYGLDAGTHTFPQSLLEKKTKGGRRKEKRGGE